ncbi:MAG: hypothetical protein H6746_08080 [Deltaproteobacteria bacterium]|nr:hypothetical protein [Deltaproteobacteria bacterium]
MTTKEWRSGSEKRPDWVLAVALRRCSQRKPTTQRPKLYRVLLHNDDYIVDGVRRLR